MTLNSARTARVRFGLGAALAGLALVSFAGAAHADPIADFYAGHSVTVLIPSGPGGGYDTYGRLISRHMGRHIPGKPNLVPQNMPGAGGVVLANYLANAAPKDGSVMAIMQNGVPFKPLFDARQIKFTNDSFRWLGSVTNVTNTAVIGKTSPITSAADVFTREVTVGASGGNTTYLPEMLNGVLGAKFKIVKGYKSTNEILLAVERNEVDGMVGIALDSLQTAEQSHPNLRVLFQMGLKRSPELPDAPLIQEFAKTDEQKAVLGAVFASFEIGRIFAVAAIPEPRLAALRKAFAETLVDSAFLTDAKKLRLNVNPETPGEVQSIIADVFRQPTPILDKAREILSGATE